MSIGSTVGGIGGAAIGNALFPGVGGVLGGIGGSWLGGMFGGKKKEKSVYEQLAEMMGAQYDVAGNIMIPKTYEFSKEWSPQFYQLGLDLTKEFSPQYAQLERDIFDQVNPEIARATGLMDELLASRGDLSSLNVSPEIIKALQQDLRGSQAARGQLMSPSSALAEARATLEPRIAERDKFINLAQQLSGRQPIFQGQWFDATAPQVAATLPTAGAMSQLQQQSNDLAYKKYMGDQGFGGTLLSGLGSVLGGSGSGGGGGTSGISDLFANLFKGSGSGLSSAQGINAVLDSGSSSPSSGSFSNSFNFLR